MSEEKPSKVFDWKLVAAGVCVVVILLALIGLTPSLTRPQIANIRILHITKFDEENNIVFCVARLIDESRIIRDIVLYDLDLASVEVDETYQILYRPKMGSYHWTVLTIKWKRNMQ